ncbi:hypothetical protein ABI59_14720 [Acidobacteria bacterium Mor1]|nr:hypothetical protein ABI59_14720 [Acidobacteria bacterium Mor1]
MKEECEECKPGAPEWMVTFGDMMSLLLAFFVLLLSFSSMELAKFKVVAGSMRDAFGISNDSAMSSVEIGSESPMKKSVEPTAGTNTLMVLQQMRQAIEKSNMDDAGNVSVDDRGVVLQLDGDALFKTGKAELQEKALVLLAEVAKVAKSQAGKMEVEGHTDNVPIRSSQFPSNWELSSARAGAAARHLVDNGLATTRIKAIGYADTRPLESNDTPEGRAKNRRIEILFVGPTDGDEEPDERRTVLSDG